MLQDFSPVFWAWGGNLWREQGGRCVPVCLSRLFQTSERDVQVMFKSEKGWDQHPLCIEDPLLPTCNTARQVTHERWNDIRQHFRAAAEVCLFT